MEVEFLTRVAALGAIGVVLVQEVLKLKFIPVTFANRYPVPTNILLSIVTSIIVVWKSTLQPVVWTDWLLLVTTISVVAAVIYNSLLRNWAELKEVEGEGNAVERRK